MKKCNFLKKNMPPSRKFGCSHKAPQAPSYIIYISFNIYKFNNKILVTVHILFFYAPEFSWRRHIFYFSIMNTQFKGMLFKHAQFRPFPYIFGIWWRKQTGHKIQFDILGNNFNPKMLFFKVDSSSSWQYKNISSVLS
jgi:hypothetical protein